jgi:hypothetical protein
MYYMYIYIYTRLNCDTLATFLTTGTLTCLCARLEVIAGFLPFKMRIPFSVTVTVQEFKGKRQRKKERKKERKRVF